MGDLNLDLNKRLNSGSPVPKPLLPPPLQTIKKTVNPSVTMPMKDRFAQIYNPSPKIAASKPTEAAKKGFFLVDFSKSKVMKDDSIYDKTFRYKTQQALKGTLRRFKDRKAVADLLWDKRGYGGITKDEAKYGLRKLESQGKLKRDQVRAIRRKMNIF